MNIAKRLRPEIGSIPLTLIVSAYLLIVTNITFWSRTAAAFSSNKTSLVAFSAAISLLTICVLVTLSVRYLIKPVLILCVLVAGAASYFTDTYGIVVDKAMVESAFVTTGAEAGHLLTPHFLFHILVFAVLPAVMIGLVRVRHRPFLQKAVRNLALIVPALGVALTLISYNYAAIAYVARERKEVLTVFNPAAPLSAAVRYARSVYMDVDLVVAPFGIDARAGDRLTAEKKPVVVVVVAGETARAANFSLDGYGRETNPELKALGVVNFRNTSSCGTATAVSLPCMFSGYRRTEYTETKAHTRQNLVDVLTHAGISVSWWDNNTGSKGIAKLTDYATKADRQNSPLCKDGECLDAIFLDGLDSKLAAVNQDTVIVLHQLGSHGPGYFARYPEEFRRFTPDCRTDELMNCSPDEIVNAYDNTILYTDHILASVAKLLAKHEDTVAGAMIYMSDHGESLGENGIYLHGAPYAIAPTEQTHVPFISWFSPSYSRTMGLDTKCLLAYSDAAMSHDNLFHTVLGMMNIQTDVYNRELDAFAPCVARS
ncbi:lipid A ethanolaminephosphotransferase [Rhizobium sp. PP-F2F-G48]|uniref:phosphoethanolamine transferase n=1 Tax=Rhizobium sp. PP-F2F-G48 TaxID=2135651 RepID=UPI0010D370E2|nr:phosphoethanolamine--lipid A transferase [Rhizobium sp. PP-F2F-G48]TCM57351.1 lipid A ethanolaminephosphotransferase [Rhizobium sp. PP-F2F-G48]